MHCYQYLQYSDYIPKEHQEKFEVPEIPEEIPVEPILTVRKDADDLTSDEQDRYINGIERLISSGFYSDLVGHHAGMHRMHGGMSGPIGYQRFLSWHRVYLSRLEEALKQIDNQTFIPYWKWSSHKGIPNWMQSFQPSGVLDRNGNELSITRNPRNPDSLPTQQQLETIRSSTTFTSFTTVLENGPHNFGHGWVGGRMNDILYSPADPLFWLHHAEVDRQWYIWQQSHPNQDPILSGADAVLDPWPDTALDVKHISDLGYSYQETT